MKITPIAVASILPAVAASAAFSVLPFTQAAPTVAGSSLAAGHAPATSAGHAAAAGPAAAARKTDAQVRSARHHATRSSAHQPAAPSAGGSAQDTSDWHVGESGHSRPGHRSHHHRRLVSTAESAFQKCVAWRESGDNPRDPDGLYGILPSVWASLGYSGTAGQASVAMQHQAFHRLYAEYGAQPWRPSDGC